MFTTVPNKFDYVIKRIMGKDVKILAHACNRTDMSCCGGSKPGCCNSLFLHTNSYCNSNCFFCISENKKAEISNFNKLRSVIEELTLKKVISKVVLTGGEPTAHPRFAEFLTLLDEYEKRLEWYSLNTNGTLLNRHMTAVNNSNLKHINISMHHYDDAVNLKIMGKCLTWGEVQNLRDQVNTDIEIRMACTITEYLHTEDDIVKYINKAKSMGVSNVIFRNEYRGFNKHLSVFQKLWGDLFTADICNCGVKLINGVNAEYRESNIGLKQAICEANTYYRDFIYKDDDMLSGSWEYGSQVIG